MPAGFTELGVVGIEDCGTYDPTRTYMKNQTVQLQGSTWIYTVDNCTGIMPGTDNSKVHIYAKGGEAVDMTTITLLGNGWTGDATNGYRQNVPLVGVTSESIVYQVNVNAATTESANRKFRMYFDDFDFGIDTLIAKADAPIDENVVLDIYLQYSVDVTGTEIGALKTRMTAAEGNIEQTNANLAPTESAGANPSRAYSVGEFMLIDGVLYQVTDAIATTDTIIIDTNVELVEDGGLNNVVSSGGGGGIIKTYETTTAINSAVGQMFMSPTQVINISEFGFSSAPNVLVSSINIDGSSTATLPMLGAVSASEVRVYLLRPSKMDTAQRYRIILNLIPNA